MARHLTLQFGRLSLNVTEEEGPSTAGSSADGPRTEPRVEPRPESTPPAATPSEGPLRVLLPRTRAPAPRPFYVVFGVPVGHEALLGVHHAKWSDFVTKLPTGGLIGSGIRDGKRFEKLEDARAYFDRRAAPELECELHEY